MSDKDMSLKERLKKGKTFDESQRFNKPAQYTQQFDKRVSRFFMKNIMGEDETLLTWLVILVIVGEAVAFFGYWLIPWFTKEMGLITMGVDLSSAGSTYAFFMGAGIYYAIGKIPIRAEIILLKPGTLEYRGVINLKGFATKPTFLRFSSYSPKVLGASTPIAVPPIAQTVALTSEGQRQIPVENIMPQQPVDRVQAIRTAISEGRVFMRIEFPMNRFQYVNYEGKRVWINSFLIRTVKEFASPEAMLFHHKRKIPIPIGVFSSVSEYYSGSFYSNSEFPPTGEIVCWGSTTRETLKSESKAIDTIDHVYLDEYKSNELKLEVDRMHDDMNLLQLNAAWYLALLFEVMANAKTAGVLSSQIGLTKPEILSKRAGLLSKSASLKLSLGKMFPKSIIGLIIGIAILLAAFAIIWTATHPVIPPVI